jgi:hypothetical protein
MARRSIQPAALSFLDTLSNGFGAIVLLYVILTARSAQVADDSLVDLRREEQQLEAKVVEVIKQLARGRKDAKSAATAAADAERESEQLAAEIAEARAQLESLARASRNATELQREVAALEVESKRLASGAVKEAGRSVRSVKGEGERQYLTGMRVDGKRILILVDRSASMLDETVVNVIRSRNLPRAEQLSAPKWQRTVKTVDWLTSQLPTESEFQIYAFNTVAERVVKESAGWLPVEQRRLDDAVAALREIAPAGGTSLHAAVAVIKELSPPPDNVYLLVDGLPTQGASKPGKGAVSGPERLAFFRDATRDLPPRTAMNVILFPMEGDPAAAPEYWWMSQLTGGSFLVPSRDWP